MTNESKDDPIEAYAKRTLDAKSARQLEKVVADFIRWQRAENRNLARLYPAPPPNKQCKTAILSGILLSNGAGLRPGNMVPYFVFGPEKAHVWTHTSNEYSALVVTVKPSIARRTLGWNTLGASLEIAGTLSTAFEHLYECQYHWMYRFRADAGFDEQEFYQDDPFAHVEAKKGSIHDLHFVADLATLLELLLRDEKFLVAAQQFLSSVSSHWFCIQCELGAFVHHPNHEPEPWEAIYLLPRLDIALVQACRVAETLIGQPGKNRQRVLARWSSALTLNPNDQFGKAGQCYLDYFCKLYDHRNDAAHGRKNIPFSLTRNIVITAQCFAWELLWSYIDKHAYDVAEAKRALKFSESLLTSEVLRDYTTKMTDPGYEAARFKELGPGTIEGRTPARPVSRTARTERKRRVPPT